MTRLERTQSGIYCRRMRKAIAAALALAFLASAACSRQDANAPATGAPADRTRTADTAVVEAAPVPEPPAPEPPATLTDVNVAAADMGGAVEDLPENYGPGLTGRRLVDGRLDGTWLTPAEWSAWWMFNKAGWAKYPVDAVLSFHERQPALIGAVTIVVPEAMTAAARRACAARNRLSQGAWRSASSRTARLPGLASGCPPAIRVASPRRQPITLAGTRALNLLSAVPDFHKQYGLSRPVVINGPAF